MGFYSLGSLPNQFAIVFCLFPYEGAKLKASDVARPTLVLDVQRNDTLEIGRLLVAYGTGTDDDDSPFLDAGPDLVIETFDAARALGLHKPTRFSMSPRRRKLLAWSDEYFVPQTYGANSAIIAGNLDDAQIARVKACFQQRQLEPYWAV